MNRHSVTLPDGSTATRNSLGRTYSHAVMVTTTHADRIATAERRVAMYASSLEQVTGPARDRYQADLDQAREQLAQLEANPQPESYAVWSWAGRPDLAAKEAARLTRRGFPATPLPATLTH